MGAAHELLTQTCQPFFDHGQSLIKLLVRQREGYQEPEDVPVRAAGHHDHAMFIGIPHHRLDCRLVRCFCLPVTDQLKGPHRTQPTSLTDLRKSLSKVIEPLPELLT